ncbi:MAG: PfkB family carbohydrate kinase [Isosphaeraceae bacterium]|nr:PfkB family carbohydrate kinase [Isosphaeraceae bacterium]
MILSVTLNPCLDKTLTVPDWKPGDSVRGRAVRTVVGGKGNNVARALKRLGRRARPVTLLGGSTGQLCESLLRSDDGLDPLVTPTAAETRTILTVRTDGSALQSAFFDPDPEISPAEATTLSHRVEGALAEGGVEALTLSGSSPCEATHGLYSDLIALARARRVPVFLDTYGPALEGIWGFWPTVIQLNRREAALHLRRPTPTEADLLGLLDRWTRHGVLLGVITDGPGVVLAQHRGQRFRVTPPRIEPVNPIGSGDCFLAGVVDAWLSTSGHDAESLLRHAVGCAVANALTWDAGAVDPEQAKQRGQEVVVEPLDTV